MSYSAYVHFIIVDVSTRRPLSSEEAIALLEDTDALNKLRENGFNAGEFKAVAPPQTKPGTMFMINKVNNNYLQTFI